MLSPRSRFDRLSKRLEKSTSSLGLNLSTRPHLCQICQGVRFSILRSNECYTHGKRDDIVTAAQAGCPLCALLLQNFDLEPANLNIRLYGIRRSLSIQEKASLVEEGDIEAIGVLNGYDRDRNNPFAHKLALYTPPDDIAASFIKRRPYIDNLASEESFRLMKSWLDTCVFHHPACTSPVIAQLPTRVINVGMRGGLQEPTLFVPPKGFKDSYVALSYCWGNVSSKLFLTKTKAQLPKPTFPLDTLPKTLKDAVHITQILGFRYLWIDSLCIIQQGDDGEDFVRESVTMHKVYGNATLTIAAAAAHSVHEGIFGHSRPGQETKCQVPYDLPDGSVGTAFVDFEEAEKGGSRIAAPLNTRGWTFQERILSPRVILFYKDQLCWDCTSTLINSNGPLNPLLSLNYDSPGRYSDYVPSGLNDGSRREKSLEYWRLIVEFYSRRKLTNQDDKLKAISGLEELVKSKFLEQYIAGVWRSDILKQLFWFTDDPSSSRQAVYRAPSWSWASINSGVKFWSSGLTWEEGLDSKVEVVVVNHRSAKSNEVPIYSLKTRGLLLLWEHHDISLEWRHRGNADIHLGSSIFLDERGIDELDFCSKQGSTEYYMFCPGTKCQSYALILKQSGSVYHRVGLCRFDMGGSWPKEMLKWREQWYKNESWEEKNLVTINIE